MKTLNISTRILSEAVWSRILDHSAIHLEYKRFQFFERMAKLDELRSQAEYNTGSVSASTCWLLYALTNYLVPTQVVEIGTFIGRSGIAMGMGIDDAGGIAEIHTCDISNKIELPQCTLSAIVQYKGTSSTEMLRQMNSANSTWQVDLVHLDGRLQNQDLALLTGMCAKDVVVVLDDFEGIEKGVTNYQAIRASGWLSSHLLIYPPADEMLKKRGFQDNSISAMLLPINLLKLTNQ